jgi:hypothetical protein
MTFGLGLPITGTFSNVNFGFELGKGPQSRSCSGKLCKFKCEFHLTTNGLKTKIQLTTRIGSSASCHKV